VAIHGFNSDIAGAKFWFDCRMLLDALSLNYRLWSHVMDKAVTKKIDAPYLVSSSSDHFNCATAKDVSFLAAVDVVSNGFSKQNIAHSIRYALIQESSFVASFNVNMGNGRFTSLTVSSQKQEDGPDMRSALLREMRGISQKALAVGAEALLETFGGKYEVRDYYSADLRDTVTFQAKKVHHVLSEKMELVGALSEIVRCEHIAGVVSVISHPGRRETLQNIVARFGPVLDRAPTDATLDQPPKLSLI
jgi:hypothetical protein